MEELPTTAPRAFCFVLMPFDNSFDDVYQLGVKDSCAMAGAYCERVDEQIFHERILDRIYNQIAKADCIIADMTGRNPNVFYEVGYAHALGKPTILLTQQADDIPFDLKHFPHIVYEGRLTDLREQLTRRLQWLVQNPVRRLAELRDPLDVWLRTELSASDRVKGHTQAHIEVVLTNTSETGMDEGAVKVAVITSSLNLVPKVSQLPLKVTTLPDGSRQFFLLGRPALLPHEVSSVSFHCHWPEMENPRMTVRVYTAMGPRDFPVKIGPPLQLESV